MPILQFPDPHHSTEEGIVALGGDLATESLLLAYRQGIFPWPMEGIPLAWFCPTERAILEFRNLHLSRSLEQDLRKARQQGTYRFTIDHAFEQVISECARSPRPGQKGTWITGSMKKAYIRLHHLKHAHSVEVWRDQVLVGGIYGVDPGGSFAGESMFYKEPNASKFALIHLCETLKEKGLEWIDIQVMTPHMEALGARLIPRNDFLKKLNELHEKKLSLFPL